MIYCDSHGPSRLPLINRFRNRAFLVCMGSRAIHDESYWFRVDRIFNVLYHVRNRISWNAYSTFFNHSRLSSASKSHWTRSTDFLPSCGTLRTDYHRFVGTFRIRAFFILVHTRITSHFNCDWISLPSGAPR